MLGVVYKCAEMFSKIYRFSKYVGAVANHAQRRIKQFLASYFCKSDAWLDAWRGLQPRRNV